MMSVAILRPTMYKAIHAIFTGQNLAQLEEIPVYPHSRLINMRLGEIDFRSYKLVLIGIQSKRESRFLFNPSDDYVLVEGDVLLVMGHHMSVSYFVEQSCNGECQR
jgi:voltage-gated potassium channel